MKSSPSASGSGPKHWLNREVLGFGITSFFSDLSHEVATTVLPLFLSSLGAPAYSVGIIEGISDGLASIAKYIGGFVSDRSPNRKFLAAIGYAVTGLTQGMFGFSTHWTHALFFRSAGWIGRGWRGPMRDALFHDAVTPQTSGRAFGFERTMDTLGAILAPMLAFFFLREIGYKNLFMLTWIPGTLAVLSFWVLIRDHREPHEVSNYTFKEGLKVLPTDYRYFLGAITLFGLSDFSHSLLIFWAVKLLSPEYGIQEASGLAILMYAFHNLIYAMVSFPAGRLADKIGKFKVLEFGYLVACGMYLGFAFAGGNVGVLFLLFGLRGFYVAIEDTLERAIAGDLLPSDIKGTGYGILAALNGFGDLFSSLIVGFLLSTHQPVLAFGYCFVLALFGTFSLMKISSGHKQK